MAVLTSVGNITFDGLMLSTGASGLSYIPENPPWPLVSGPASPLPGRALAVDCFFLDFMKNARSPILIPCWLCLSVWMHFFLRKLTQDMLRGPGLGSCRFSDP